MELLVSVFKSSSKVVEIGTIKNVHKIEYLDLMLKIYTIFKKWTDDNEEKNVICKVLFIDPAERNKEWTEWRAGYIALANHYYHAVYNNIKGRIKSIISVK